MSSYFCTVTIIVKVDRKGCGREGEGSAKRNGELKEHGRGGANGSGRKFQIGLLDKS